MLNWLKTLLTGRRRSRSAPPAATVAPTRVTPLVPEQSAQAVPLPVAATQWLPPGQTVHIGPYVLSGGLIYVGDELAGIHDQVGIEPALIRPQLKIDAEHPDTEGVWMTQWPSYSEIPSSCRAAYLDWLAQGRCDRNIPIDYVYLFFYGLERRVIHELRLAEVDATAELTLIIAELERLQTLYAESHGFAQDAARLRSVCWALLPPEGFRDLAPAYQPDDRDQSEQVQIALGRMAGAQLPLTADWALLWYFHAPKVKLKPVENRCLTELSSLFGLRYGEQFPEGLRLPPDLPQVPVQMTYQPASVSFGGPVELVMPPYAKGLAAPLDPQLKSLVQDCLEALMPYGRWLGRNPEGRGSFAAVLLLPSAIAPEYEQATVRKFRVWLGERLATVSHCLVPGQLLLEQWAGEVPPPSKLTKTEAVTLSNFLAKLNINLEPDVLYGGKPVTAQRPVVLFRGAQPAEPVLAEEYTTALLLLHLATLVIQAPEQACAAGQAHIETYLASTPHLQAWERERLTAHFAWLCAEKQTLRGLKSRLKPLSLERKRAIATFLLGVAQAPATPHPETLPLLAKLYPLLNLEADLAQQHLYPKHQATPESTPEPTPESIPAPTESPPTQPPLDLNLDLIQQRQAESATAATLLADIFTELPEISPSTPAATVDAIAGLDAAHTQLLQTLRQQSTWPRSILEERATELGLFLDGALENLNDLAFDHCDEPLTEGEDPIEVNQEILQELVA